MICCCVTCVQHVSRSHYLRLRSWLVSSKSDSFIRSSDKVFSAASARAWPAWHSSATQRQRVCAPVRFPARDVTLSALLASVKPRSDQPTCSTTLSYSMCTKSQNHHQSNKSVSASAACLLHSFTTPRAETRVTAVVKRRRV